MMKTRKQCDDQLLDDVRRMRAEKSKYFKTHMTMEEWGLYMNGRAGSNLELGCAFSYFAGKGSGCGTDIDGKFMIRIDDKFYIVTFLDKPDDNCRTTTQKD